MVVALKRDVETISRALRSEDSEISVSLSRETLELVLRVARAQENETWIPRRMTKPELSPNEAADFLGMSRPQVRKLMNEGLLDFRMVGKHHRISLESLKRFEENETARQAEGMKELASLQNELGLTD
ncbi:MAG: helix-turn-helix domain-containing protein [Actinomycetaceae bacterium]|nr:helix-turn-helix domain-containing protein [Actinomycetaceae bacterium]